MSKSSVTLRNACALIACASLTVVAGYAQQAASETPVKLDKYVVTGSNIPTTETAGEARTFPVLTIDRKAIDESGMFNTTELLQKMTLSNGGSVPLSNNATGFTPGASSTSLRGLGPEATLVLINGRRVAPYPVGAGGTTAFVDLNTIPLAAIERVEVLKDGASATYGADAVAGVVNIILRKNYDGATATVSYGNTTNKDSSDFNANFVYGVTSDKGSLTFGANYQQRQPIFNRDRTYSAVPPFLSSNASPPNFQLTRDAVLLALGLPAGSPITINGVANTTTNTFFGSTYAVRTTNNGNLPASAYTFTTGRSSSFNYNEFSGSYPEVTRKGMFTAWERDLGSNVHIFGDAMYQDIVQYDELAPYATGNFASPGQKTIVIPAKTANPILTAAEIASGLGRTAVAGAYNPFNPFNQDISGSSRIRLAEFGNRVYQNHNTAYAMTGGMRVDNIADKWTLNAQMRYSTIENAGNYRLINTSRMLRSLNANDPIFNPASPEYIGTTIPYNPFGYYKNSIPSNSAVVKYGIQYERDRNSSQMLDGGANLTTGELLTLPGGDVGFAIGVDFRREAINQNPDSALQAGEILAATAASPISRQRKVMSYYAEAEIPIFSEKHSVDFAKKLSLNLAGRYEDFVTSKQTTFVPKVGLKWMPVDENLVVRASWGKGFLQPSLYQLFAPPVNALTPINDPVSHVNEPEQPVTSAGNKNLKPEDSKSYNVGVVWTPKSKTLEGFTFSVDAWRIERIGTVSIDYQDTLNRSLTNKLIPGESIVRDFANNLVQVNSVYRNLGKTIAQGLDLATSYTWKTETLGRFEAGVNAVYMSSYKVDSIGDGNLTELIGQAIPGSASDDAYLRWKGQTWLDWTYQGLSTHLSGTYTDSFGDFDLNGDPRKVASTMIYDLQFTYKLFPSKGPTDRKLWSDMKVTVGCNNVLDTNPPLAQDGGNNSNNYPGFLYTDEGRFVYMKLEKKL